MAKTQGSFGQRDDPAIGELEHFERSLARQALELLATQIHYPLETLTHEACDLWQSCLEDLSRPAGKRLRAILRQQIECQRGNQYHAREARRHRESAVVAFLRQQDDMRVMQLPRVAV